MVPSRRRLQIQELCRELLRGKDYTLVESQEHILSLNLPLNFDPYDYLLVEEIEVWIGKGFTVVLRLPVYESQKPLYLLKKPLFISKRPDKASK